MSFLFGSPKLPPVPSPEPKPEVTPEDQGRLIADQREEQRKSRGRRSTMLTSGQGILDRPSTLKTTLGGY